MLAIYGFPSMSSMFEMQGKIASDVPIQKERAALEFGNDPIMERSAQLLAALEDSPEVEWAVGAGQSRIFELRTYHSTSWPQLVALHRVLNGRENGVFRRARIKPILQSSTVNGEHLPNLTYLIPFADLTAREKAWMELAADQEWTRRRKDLIDAHAREINIANIAIYRSTPYSPVV